MSKRPFFAAIVVALCLFAAPASAQYVGKEFPNFTATDAISGERFALKDFRGKVVLIDFWATWCGPCVKELPNVKRAYREYKDQGFAIISISLDQDQRKFKGFVRGRGMRWHHVMSGKGWNAPLAKKYNVRGIPKMFIIDPNGICISESARGKALERAIEKGLARIPAGGPSRGEDRGGRSANQPRRSSGPIPERATPELLEARHRAKDLRDTVAAAAGPYRRFEDELASIEKEIDYTAQQMPAPRNPRSTAKAFGRMLDDLARLRHDMFVCGLLAGTVPSIPDNPFAGDAVDDRNVAGLIRPRLEPARTSAGALEEAFQEAHRDMDSIVAELHAVETSSDLEAALSACQAAEGFAASLETTFRAPWRSCLKSLDQALEARSTTSSPMTAKLDGLDGRIDACRELLLSAARSPSAAAKLREQLTGVCADLRELVEKAVADGTLAALPADMPENPLKSGRSVDVRSRVEASRQLDRAGTLTDELRGASDRASARLAAYVEQVRALQIALEAAAGDEAKVRSICERFEKLCYELLALADG